MSARREGRGAVAQGFDGANAQGFDGANAQGFDGANAQGFDGANGRTVLRSWSLKRSCMPRK